MDKLAQEFAPPSRIDLAREADFALGALRVRPSRREVEGLGTRRILQRRVMQVLVALARSPSAVVSQQELILRCWNGLTVSDDAIGRCIAQLRRLAEGWPAPPFEIETIAGVGYSLTPAVGRVTWPEDAHGRAPWRPVSAEAAAVDRAGMGARSDAPVSLRTGPGHSRRGLLALGATAAAAAAVGGVAWFQRWRSAQPPSPQAAALVNQSLLSVLQDTRESQNQAIGLMQKVVGDFTSWADGWGALGFVYAETAHCRSTQEAGPLRERARHAVATARSLASDDGYAAVAAATVLPRRGTWLGAERAFRAAFRDRPNAYALLYALADVLCDTGRHGEAASLYEVVRRHSTPSPGIYYREIMALWGADRLEQSDRLLTEAISVFPTHFALWFARFYSLMYGGRPEQALSILEDQSSRPSGIAPVEFEQLRALAHAFVSRTESEIGQVVAAELARARLGAGFAENTIQYASALGRLDDAFATAEAYYFGAAYTVPEVRFTVERGVYTPIAERQAAFLFYPSTAQMRADPRFHSLVQRLGLVDYWHATGSQPDDA